ncbi:hypothetical protein PPGU19_097140 (plasmid) [Paraburkholderia sp. PGU19]|nr:hypothetical protein PPGU19_097140 [Paraburkholderia sp. PGU19]
MGTSRMKENPVGNGGLASIDVGNDADVAYAGDRHGGCGHRSSPGLLQNDIGWRSGAALPYYLYCLQPRQAVGTATPDFATTSQCG